MATQAHEPLAELEYDYEALPENFSLGANMIAGAFAGIAVGSCRNRNPRGVLRLTSSTGTLSDVPYRSAQGTLHLLASTVEKLTESTRPECKSSILHQPLYTRACRMPLPRYRESKACARYGEGYRVSSSELVWGTIMDIWRGKLELTRHRSCTRGILRDI